MSETTQQRLYAAEPGPKSATVQEEVYGELRRSLMTGVFRPGEKLSLRTLSEQMGTSIMPVREAINRLVAERAFDLLPNRQIQVPIMTAPRFAEIAHWRIALETHATRMACRWITPDAIETLVTLNARMIDAAAGDRRNELLPINYDFHFAIYRQSRSTVVLPMIESLWLQQGPFTFYSSPSPLTLWDAQHHVELIAALRVRDADRAAAALSADIERTVSYLQAGGYYGPPKMARVARG